MKTAQDRARYAAFKARDARFDGRFFVGVSSTGIYCRPVCPARLPLEANCSFFATAAEAEQAGFRPCLLCRPELAPGRARIDATASLAHQAARLIEEECASGQGISDFAARLGCSARHLRRAFAAEFRVTPIRYLQTSRLLLAKSLLTDTRLSVTEVAMAAGFNSLRRFNDLFGRQYRMPPTALRRQSRGNTAAESGPGSGPARPCPSGLRPASADPDLSTTFQMFLGYRPPYHWEGILEFLKGRAIPGVEAISRGSYRRTVSLPDPDGRTIRGWVQVADQPGKNALALTVSMNLLPVLPGLLSRVRFLFDLNADPEAVLRTLGPMNRIRPGLCRPGARLPGCFDPFEMAVRAVLGQQISVKAAGTLAGRLAGAFGHPLETGLPGLTRTFPTAEAMAALPGEMAGHLGPLGIPRVRAGTIQALARSIRDRQVDLRFCQRPEEEIEKLKCLPGIGEWTAQYIAMRAMGWPDAFPHTDLGIKKALAPLTESQILELAESWRPWRGYATINIWQSFNPQGG